MCWVFYKKIWYVPGDYFLTSECLRENGKIKRGKEGLFIHHIDENKAELLSDKESAKRNLFEYQKAERLVYCNLLEHLLLHIKIFEYSSNNKNMSIGGICCFLVPELNDIYSGIKYEKPWKQKVAENVLPFKSDYLKCIKKLIEKKFPSPLLTSLFYNEIAGLWNKKNNEKFFKELTKIGVKF